MWRSRWAAFAKNYLNYLLVVNFQCFLIEASLKKFFFRTCCIQSMAKIITRHWFSFSWVILWVPVAKLSHSRSANLPIVIHISILHLGWTKNWSITQTLPQLLGRSRHILRRSDFCPQLGVQGLVASSREELWTCRWMTRSRQVIQIQI